MAEGSRSNAALGTGTATILAITSGQQGDQNPPEQLITSAAYRRDPRLGGAITFGMNGFAQTPLPAEGVWLREGQALAGNWRFD